ncbi:MAG: hypothetical protein KJP21_08670, partial [Bacteroidia bacterium]|nr:hypothetical protein [Bacteroidia bacterium]
VTPSTEQEHSGAITADETWTADQIHYIKGRCWVENGATLTINPGTIIKGRTGTEANAAALIIARGSDLIAEGSANQPIIFTSELDNIEIGQITGTNLDENDRGKWGGLIMLGAAKISAEDGDVEARIEGIPATESYGVYGGSDDNDNSGTVTYVSIRHGGALLGEGNEINGLTLGGVGNGTTIHHVEVVANVDDGIEWFGGSVNVDDAIVYYQGDDALDIDMNFSGTVDNFIVIQGGDTDEGLEVDGPEGSTYTDGQFTLKNGTLISNDGNGSAADLKSKTQGTIENCYFTGYSKFLKVRVSFSDTTNCTIKTDAYTNLTDASPKLIVQNSDIYSSNSPTIADMGSGYTGSCKTCGCVDSSIEGMIDAEFGSNGNSVTGSSSNGANTTEFETWTWVDSNGNL